MIIHVNENAFCLIGVRFTCARGRRLKSGRAGVGREGEDEEQGRQDLEARHERLH